ncbi:MAG TPA: hypothetical protein VM820_17045 [Vicinamibacterales bacterium]|jgi:hypothetical protein|nr:hypothetical protein [Vicinamibacterales bacterium]
MTRWAPWLLAFIVWNGAFDFQVRRAGEAFTTSQVDRWRQQAPPLLIRDAFTPNVHRAGLRASAAAAVVLLLGLAWTHQATRPAHR